MFALQTWFMIVLCRLHTYRHEFQVWCFFTSIQTQRQAAVTLMNRCSFISCSRLRRHCSVRLPAHTAWKHQHILLSSVTIRLPSAHSLSRFLPLRGDRGILMLSQTMDNLGDFLCTSVIWFCPEAALLSSLLSGWPEPWKSDFPLSPLPFSCGHVWMRRVRSYCGVI